MFGDEPIIEPADNAGEQPLIEEEQQQVQEPQPLEYKDPEVEDTYNKVEDDRERAKFLKELEEQYPIKGNAKLEDVNTKDPSAVKKFFEDMQNNTRTDAANENSRNQAIRDYDHQQQDKYWSPVYKAYPQYRGDDNVKRIIGAIAKDAGCSPLASANFVTKWAVEMYNKGFNAARQHTQQIPSKPVGNQSKATPIKINEKALYDKVSGSEDDVAEAVAALQKAGVGGL